MTNSQDDYNMIFMSLMELMRLHKSYFERNILFSKHDVSNIKIPEIGILILFYLKYHDNVNQKTLSNKFKVSEAFISKITNELDDSNFIIRKINEDNKREKLLSLSDKGNSFIDDFISIDKKWEKELIEDMSSDEFEIFKKVLNKFIEKSE